MKPLIALAACALMTGCAATSTPGSTTPADTTAPAVSPTKAPTVKPTPKPKAVRPKPRATTKAPSLAPPTTEPPAVYYANCTAVRAAGAAPIYRGEPGYRPALDRDDDGIACEV